MVRFLYALAKFLNDMSAVSKGKVGPRIGRRLVGKATGRGIGRMFK